jgi:hypothetical protein
MSFGAPGVSGYSPFFDPTLARPGNGAEVDYNAMPRYGRASSEMCISTLLAKGGFRGVRRVLRSLIGAAPGAAAAESYTRVGTVQQESITGIGPGGLRTMETYVANSGNTTSAQETYIENLIVDARYNQNPSSYPVDLAGVGGGGKLGV